MLFLTNIIWAIRKGFSPKAAVLCDINFNLLPQSTRILHPYGITIGVGATVGENVTLAQHVTIMGHCTIGEGVFIGANAVIFRGVTIGANAKIGVGALVLKDVPADFTVTGVYK